jgi:hypothetical protein
VDFPAIDRIKQAPAERKKVGAENDDLPDHKRQYERNEYTQELHLLKTYNFERFFTVCKENLIIAFNNAKVRLFFEMKNPGADKTEKAPTRAGSASPVSQSASEGKVPSL